MSFFCCSLSSGSKGNCQYIETNKTKILVDAGFTGKRIEALLKGIHVNAQDLDGIFVTHEHRDHVQAVGVLARRHQIPVYATAGTWQGMLPIVKDIPQHLIRIIDGNKTEYMEDLGLFAIPTQHDAVDPVAFVISWEDKKLSFITDTGWLTPTMINTMEGSDYYFIEANHDIDTLKHGPYPLSLKQRILGVKGHMSNEHAGTCLGRLLQGRGERIVLGHLSEENNTPEMAFKEVEKQLRLSGYIEGQHYCLNVARQLAQTFGISWD